MKTMLIDFNCINKYKIIPKGIVHIGMHQAEEYSTYKEAGVSDIVFIEANPKLIESCPINDTKCLIINAAVSNEEKNKKFYIANNGHSSSLLEFSEHSKIYPHIEYIDQIIINTKTLDTIYKTYNLNLNLFNIFNFDIQGHELAAMMGFHYWDYIDAVFTEVNYVEMYSGCSLKYQIDDFMNLNDMICVEESNTGAGWGDALYIKKKYMV